MLARRYFISRGPATLKDFVWWSGLTVAEGQQALNMVDGEISSAEIEGQVYFFSSTLRETHIQPKTVHLLPAFDEYLIAYADRSSVITENHHVSKAISSNGIFHPVILQDGIVVGTWKNVGKKIMESYF